MVLVRPPTVALPARPRPLPRSPSATAARTPVAACDECHTLKDLTGGFDVWLAKDGAQPTGLCWPSKRVKGGGRLLDLIDSLDSPRPVDVVAAVDDLDLRNRALLTGKVHVRDVEQPLRATADRVVADIPHDQVNTSRLVTGTW